MDGVHVLRKRKNTRLWYRQLPVQPQRIINPDDSADVPDDQAWEQLFAELSDEAASEAAGVEVTSQETTLHTPTLPAAPIVIEIAAPTAVKGTQPALPALVERFGEDWRTVPN